MSQSQTSRPQSFKGSYEIEQVNGQWVLVLQYGWIAVAGVLPSGFDTFDEKKKSWAVKSEIQILRKRLEWRIKQERTKLKMAG